MRGKKEGREGGKEGGKKIGFFFLLLAVLFFHAWKRSQLRIKMRCEPVTKSKLTLLAA